MRTGKTIIFQTLLCFAILATAFYAGAQEQADRAPILGNNNNTSTTVESVDAMWDLAFDYDVSTAPDLGSLAGAVHIGNEFWVAVWNSDTLVRYENDGSFIEKFAMPELFNVNSNGVRAMTWDGTSIWVANNTSTVYQVDPTTKSIVSQFTVTGTSEVIRFLSFDETADGGNGGFWVGNFNTDIFLIRMDGMLLSSIPEGTHQLGGMYGAAVDTDSPGGPYLWVFHQAGTPTDALISQLDLSTGMPTGVARDVNIDLNTPLGLAGGLFISKDWDPNGGMILGGVDQANPDRLFGYELDFVPSAAIDLATSNVTSPVTGCDLTNAEIVTFEINNIGETDLTDIPLELLVNGMSMAVDTFFGTLATGTSTTFTFSTSIDLTVPGNYIIGVRTTESTDINNANDLTNAVVGSKALATPPLIEDFDGFTLGTTIFSGLYNAGLIPFQVNNGATGSNNTGPSGTASGTGNYIYMETSGGRAAGESAVLTSDCIDLTGTYEEATLTFDYHMFGAAIGFLNVEVVSSGMTTSLLILNGQQQTLDTEPWQTATIDLTSYLGSEIEINISGTIADNGAQVFLCDIALDNFSLVACSPPGISPEVTNDVNNGSIGAIALNLSGGTAPFTFNWSNGAMTQDLSNLAAGTYTVSVSDANSCTYIESFELVDACASLAIEGTVTDVVGATLGSIELNVSGGTEPYTFLWSNNETTAGIMNLAAGDYSCLITDALGCNQFLEFMVDEVNAVADVKGLSVLELAPNPTTGRVQIQLELERNMDVDFTLLDISGREILSARDRNIQVKTYELNLQEKSSGVYFARFVLEGQVVTRKLVLNK